MAQLPDAFGMSVTVEDMEPASRFYKDLYPHDNVSEGVFAGIPYIGIMRDGETLVNISRKCLVTRSPTPSQHSRSNRSPHTSRRSRSLAVTCSFPPTHAPAQVRFLQSALMWLAISSW